MNLSLKNRIAASFLIATTVVLILIFVVFQHLNTLNKDIQAISGQTEQGPFGGQSIFVDESTLLNSVVSILKNQRKLLSSNNSSELKSTIENMIKDCENFTKQLKTIDEHSQGTEVGKIVTRMLSYADSLTLVLKKNILSSRNNDGKEAIGDLTDKILESFSHFQKTQYTLNKKIIEQTKQRMMIILLIGFLFTVLLSILIPGKITLPFKKLKEAIRELRDCNFDVNIYYSVNDEIGELAQEMNKMIHAFKKFDELRTDRISVENRKFDALANMTDLLILVANNEGKLIYMNNRLYSLLQVQSEEVIGQDMDSPSSPIPAPLSEACQLAIKRRSKMENLEIRIDAKHPQEENNADKNTSSGKNPIFQGYTTITPVRGKESSLDYYLMILSKNPQA